MSNKTLHSITSDIESELSEIIRARSVLCTATEPLECKGSFDTEDGYALVHAEHIMNLLHVTDGLLFGTYQKLQKAAEALYSMSRKQDIAQPNGGKEIAMNKKSATEVLFYNYNQSEEYFKATRAVESKYNPKYEKFMDTMSPGARDEFDETIACNCDEYCLLGFKLGMAAALNIKAETDMLFGAAFKTIPEKGGAV